jgi:hypothetical protein
VDTDLGHGCLPSLLERLGFERRFDADLGEGFRWLEWVDANPAVNSSPLESNQRP